MTDHKIPLNVYMTWCIQKMPTFMNLSYETLKKQNPEFTFHLYDDNHCREFIKNNFDGSVLDAYDRLIPGAYKADLWRYCILYKYGGVYLDIKYKCANNFKLIKLINDEHFVKDREHFFRNKNGIHNAFIISFASNKIFLDCILQIVDNVKNKYYGHNALYPTGPGLLENIVMKNNHSINCDLIFDGNKILYNNESVLITYREYRHEQNHTKNYVHYDTLWRQRKIYV